MQNFFSNTISTIGINDVLDILITTFILYKILEFIKDTRAQQLLKGLLFVIAAYFVADYMNLYVVHWILKAVFTVGLEEQGLCLRTILPGESGSFYEK